MAEFSFRTRQSTLKRFAKERFDLLVIGGGITGAAVARDASSRGLSVALVERDDFANGTSSRSSKLIHGGLRYLENMEFKLVFEALSERALLLKTAPHMVRPLPFYLPVYKGDSNGMGILSLGLWLYDLLALFRTPEFHRRLSRKKMLKTVPFLKQEGLVGGFRYYDASMWDDALTVETLRSASAQGAAIANYVEAESPIWEAGLIQGFRVRDRSVPSGAEIEIRANRVVVCAGPWTDMIGEKMDPRWRHWLQPSKGVHLIFDLKRLPIPGAMVMSHPEDGRVSFVIPRTDFGTGVVIVGTTDGPAPKDPAKVDIDPEEVQYLLRLLNKYFPEAKLGVSDILSAYVGVRPLFGDLEGGIQTGDAGARADHPAQSALQPALQPALQKVSREHHIGEGPGGTVVIAGGKYTTHRAMAEEIVDFVLGVWRRDFERGTGPSFPLGISDSNSRLPVNPKALPEVISAAEVEARKRGWSIPRELISRYGAEAIEIMEDGGQNRNKDPDGFPYLEGQLRFAIRNEMALHLEDFYLRRMPFFAARADHGMPWAEKLARVWAQEMGASEDAVRGELERLSNEVARRSAWKQRCLTTF